MSVLRVYDPPECDEHGVPLDWERCRACVPGHTRSRADDVVECSRCDGHGSLRAAALAWAAQHEAINRPDPVPVAGPRCEDCGHPASEGTWTECGYEPMANALRVLRAGCEPLQRAVHFSPCDEGCRHGGPGRWHGGASEDDWTYSDLSPHFRRREASWRPVDVRTLGWPMDLRPERLAVLCLRCWANRGVK